MKRLTRLFACCLFLMDLACFGQGTSISIINNSQSWLQIYRIGNPSYSVEVQKRWNQMITLPLASGGGEDAQMIEISREGTSIVTPETSFQGFDGSFSQNCTITVNDSSVSISYTDSGGSSTNAADSSNANNTNSLNNGAGGGGGGGGTGGGMGMGGYRGSSTGTNNSQAAAAFDYTAKSAPPKKNVLAGATGVRVRVARPDAAKVPTLEAPSSGLAKTNSNKLESIPSVTSLPPEPPKRTQNGYYIAGGAILLVIVLFVASKIRENNKPRNPYRRPSR